jgi:peptidoglycan/xylan/chitin deacetylase (PgdA/CDA1 family)
MRHDEAVAEEERQAAGPGSQQGDGGAVPDPGDRAGPPARKLLIVGVLLVLVLVGVVLWQGANTHTGAWFGHQISHGPRDGNEVALTFDDGPNSTATVPILDALDARGVKGTFFMVGKAIVARPDLARVVAHRGHLVGNHSYRHDSKGWLDPRYPELARTQRVVDRDLGVCPAFYRAPHGQHTPFLARVVGRNGLTMIGWDVSAGDWRASNARHLADLIVAKARPGSIIDLHDGLDGRVDADRTVLVGALPLILDGLAAKGLQPVRLDELMARPGYLERC